MKSQWAIDNARERERLHTLVEKITDKQLNLVIYKEGWTIAVALAHLAFWDERRRVMVKIWKQKGVAQSPFLEDIFNDSMLPLLLIIPPRKAAELAVKTADAIDRELEKLPPQMIKDIDLKSRTP
ncbi:MAG TPA: maleylpyruvate isomerase N-terminal domain-containing protein [Dehalococcoidales bacterium]|nr:maleylpyruvate isomerase N-terminal domain-containing protein [Dehalococcoidales bacterium]